MSDESRSTAQAALELTRKIGETLFDHPPDLVAPALAGLMAEVIARHAPERRANTRRALFELVGTLIPVEVLRMRETGVYPPDWHDEPADAVGELADTVQQALAGKSVHDSLLAVCRAMVIGICAAQGDRESAHEDLQYYCNYAHRLLDERHDQYRGQIEAERVARERPH